jgi:hypothetical protein
MVLKSSEEQKREIRKVIDEQQDKRTVNYHQWVTPEEFGEHFGVHDADIEQIKEPTTHYSSSAPPREGHCCPCSPSLPRPIAQRFRGDASERSALSRPDLARWQ